MSGLPPQQLAQLKMFVQMVKGNPNIIYMPEMSFLKEWLESMGANIPPPNPEEEKSTPKPKPAKEPEPEPVPDPESEESDVELDNTGVEEDPDDFMPEYPSMDVDVTEESMDAANDKRGEAMAALSEGNTDEAIKLFTEAIKLNPNSAIFYAKRAQAYIRMKKLKAAIHDCDKAIDLNPDSAPAYKYRGKAKKMLGQWEESFHDLSLGCKLDYDDDTNDMLKQVKPNAMKIQEHNRKYQRKREEREINERKERVRKAKEAQEKARQESQSSGGMPGGMPGGAPGGAGGMPDLSQLIGDPEILAAFQDPEVAAAFSDISQNPANISKYQSNPRVQKVIEKMAKKFGMSPGDVGPTSDGAGGAGEGPGGQGSGAPPPSSSGAFDVD